MQFIEAYCRELYGVWAPTCRALQGRSHFHKFLPFIPTRRVSRGPAVREASGRGFVGGHEGCHRPLTRGLFDSLQQYTFDVG